MYHFFVQEEQIGDDLIFIEGQDVNHIRNVLRMREGEQICVSSREGGKEFRAQITALESGRVTARILWAVEPEAELPPAGPEPPERRLERLLFIYNDRTYEEYRPR